MDSLTKALPTPATLHVQYNGLSFPVLSWGPTGGRPILLLHGFPQEPSTWAPIGEALGQGGFRLLAPFQRGYVTGTRPKGPGGYSFDKFVDDAVAIADAFGLKTFDVAGFGIGGAQAWMLAAYHPMRVRSLTSIRFPHPAAFAGGVRLDPDQKEKWRRLQEQFGAGDTTERAAKLLADNASGLRRFLATAGLPEPSLDRYVSRLSEPGALAGALSWEQAISLEEFSQVPAVTAPTLLIWSEGAALARTSVEATREYVHGRFTEVDLKDTGHFILETAPQSIVEPLRRHLLST